MGRKCSHCGDIGHNLRTCTTNRRGTTLNNIGGPKLFGVQLNVSSSNYASNSIKKCFSMDCLSSTSSSPSSPLCSSRLSIDDSSDKTSIGYLSDGLIGREQERKKGIPWTEEEHRLFLIGLEKLGKGNWRGISRHFVTTRTPTQVASHAQKYFLRLSSLDKKTRRRSSLFDTVNGSIHNSANSRPRHPLPTQYLKPIPSFQECAWSDPLGPGSSEPILDSDLVHGLKEPQLPKASINPSMSIPSNVSPNLELSLAVPTSLEANKESPGSLLIRRIA